MLGPFAWQFFKFLSFKFLIIINIYSNFDKFRFFYKWKACIVKFQFKFQSLDLKIITIIGKIRSGSCHQQILQWKSDLSQLSLGLWTEICHHLLIYCIHLGRKPFSNKTFCLKFTFFPSTVGKKCINCSMLML